MSQPQPQSQAQSQSESRSPSQESKIKQSSRDKVKSSEKSKKIKAIKPLSLSQMAVLRRLDESIPLNTPEWHKVEQMLMQLLEFAPADLVSDAATAIAFYADDQARRGYILGANDSQEKVA